MKLNELFLKDVTRSIEGVVKADDVDHLGIEVEEYVLTNDAARPKHDSACTLTPTPTYAETVVRAIHLSGLLSWCGCHWSSGCGRALSGVDRGVSGVVRQRR